MGDIKIEVKRQDSFLAAVYMNGLLYYSSWLSNGLFVLDLSSGVANLVDTFEESATHGLHISASLIMNEIWFFPANADKIAKLNIYTNQITYAVKTNGAKGIFKFVGALNWKNKVILIPKGADSIIEIDKNVGMMKAMVDWHAKNQENSRMGCGFSCAVTKEEWLYLFPSEENGYFCKVNMAHGGMGSKLKYILATDDAVVCAGAIYLLSNNKLYRFDEERYRVDEVLSFAGYKGEYRKMFVFNEKIWLPPYTGKLIIICEPCERKVEIKRLVFEAEDNCLAFYGKNHFDDFEIISSSYGKCQHLLVGNNTIRTVSCNVDEMSVVEYLLRKGICERGKVMEPKDTGREIYKYLSSI